MAVGTGVDGGGLVALADPGSDVTITDLRRRLTGADRFASAADVAVVDGDGGLVGPVRIEDVLAADGAVLVTEVMDADPPVIGRVVGDVRDSCRRRRSNRTGGR